MFVVFEGLDKSGKGTLEWEFLRATNFKHVVIDRGPVGYYVFDSVFDRSTLKGDIEHIKSAGIMMGTNSFMIVYCRAPSEVALERIKDYNEECPYDYDKAQKLYDFAINAMYDKEKVVVVDTTKSIKECVNEIIKKLEVLKGEYD